MLKQRTVSAEEEATYFSSRRPGYTSRSAKDVMEPDTG